MMGTDLAYQQIGAIFAIAFISVFAFVIVYRLIISFRNYLYTGDFGAWEKCALFTLIDGDLAGAIKYAFKGHHPAMVVLDGVVFSALGVFLVVLWAPAIVVGLFLLLATMMRKRIAHKQEFTARLEGTYEND